MDSLSRGINSKTALFIHQRNNERESKSETGTHQKTTNANSNNVQGCQGDFPRRG